MMHKKGLQKEWKQLKDFKKYSLHSQLHGNSFCGDFVLDSFNKPSACIRTTAALKLNFMSSLLLCSVFLYLCISGNHSENLKSSNKDPKIFAFIYIWSKMMSSSLYAMLKLSKTIAVPI